MSLREWTTKSNFSDNSPTSRSFVNRPGLAAASTTSGLLWSASPCDVDVSTTNSTSGCAACRHRTVTTQDVRRGREHTQHTQRQKTALTVSSACTWLAWYSANSLARDPMTTRRRSAEGKEEGRSRRKKVKLCQHQRQCDGDIPQPPQSDTGHNRHTQTHHTRQTHATRHTNASTLRENTYQTLLD